MNSLVQRIICVDDAARKLSQVFIDILDDLYIRRLLASRDIRSSFIK